MRILGIFASPVKSVVTGGTLTSDSTYYYRTFTSNDTLTVSRADLAATILVIAGGGGGGSSTASNTTGFGGGAGGSSGINNTSVTFAIGSTSVTVGGGGAGGPLGAPGQSGNGSGGSPSSIGATTSTGGGGGYGYLGGGNGGSAGSPGGVAGETAGTATRYRNTNGGALSPVSGFTSTGATISGYGNGGVGVYAQNATGAPGTQGIIVVRYLKSAV